MRWSKEQVFDFHKKVIWVEKSKTPLSEDCIRNNREKISWYNICLFQNLSKEFIIEFWDRIYIEPLLQNENLSEEIKNYIRMFI